MTRKTDMNGKNRLPKAGREAIDNLILFLQFLCGKIKANYDFAPEPTNCL